VFSRQVDHVSLPETAVFKVLFFCSVYKDYKDRLCGGLVVRVPGYRRKMNCSSCEVRTQFIYVMLEIVDYLCGLVVRVPG
jgi:hypothetical protein